MPTKQRLLNDSLARILHAPLYQRIVNFAQQYTPEIPGEAVAAGWLNRLYSGDANLHILVTLDDNYKITGHAVIDVQEAYGYRVVFCYQAQADKNNQTTLDEGIEYIDKLVQQVSAYCSVFTVVKGMRGLDKKYGYSIARTTMIKYRDQIDA